MMAVNSDMPYIPRLETLTGINDKKSINNMLIYIYIYIYIQ